MTDRGLNDRHVYDDRCMAVTASEAKPATLGESMLLLQVFVDNFMQGLAGPVAWLTEAAEQRWA